MWVHVHVQICVEWLYNGRHKRGEASHVNQLLFLVGATVILFLVQLTEFDSHNGNRACCTNIMG